MQLSEAETIQKYAIPCEHCLKNTCQTYEYEFTCIECGYDENKQKNELGKVSRKRVNFVNRLKDAQHKINCSFKDYIILHEGIDLKEMFEAVSNLKKNQKLMLS